LAVVDGKYSIDVYLDCMQEAWVGYAKRAEALLGVPLGKLYDAVQYFLFHVPFPRMAEYAALRIFSTSWLDDAGMRERIATEVPVVSGALDSRASRQQFERALSRTSLFRDAFARKIGPSLSLSRDVGNVYSGSLYLALISLFEQTRSRDLTGSRIALGSYGSGASAKMLSAIVCKEYAPLVDRMRLHEELRPEHEGGTRVALSLSDYERLHGLADTEIDVGEAVASKLRHGSGLSPAEGDALRAALEKPRWRVMPRSASIRAPRGEFALARLGTCATAERTDLGYRYYEWVEP
jgi:hydroxymethylglutaryl-CoA synthase